MSTPFAPYIPATVFLPTKNLPKWLESIVDKATSKRENILKCIKPTTIRTIACFKSAQQPRHGEGVKGDFAAASRLLLSQSMLHSSCDGVHDGGPGTRPLGRLGVRPHGGVGLGREDLLLQVGSLLQAELGVHQSEPLLLLLDVLPLHHKQFLHRTVLRGDCTVGNARAGCSLVLNFECVQ